MNDRKTTGFGVPNDIDPHHFVVEIPAARAILWSSPSTSACGRHQRSAGHCRPLQVASDAWNAVRKELERVLNERLKEKKLGTAAGRAARTRSSVSLGRELCVLPWAVEAAPREAIPNAVRNWIALKPDERWWLFSMAASTQALATT